MGKLSSIGWRLFVLMAAVMLVVPFLANFLSASTLHEIAELLTIILSFSIVTVIWNARRFQNNSYLVFIGVGFLFNTGLTIFNALDIGSTRGLFPYYEFREMAIEEIISLYILGFSFLFAPLLLHRKLKVGIIFLIHGMILLFLLALVFYWRLSSESLVEANGLTTLGTVNESILMLVLLGAVAQLLRHRREFDWNILQLLITAIAIALVSRAVLIINTDQSTSLLVAGQFFQLISFYLFYVAFVEVGIAEPHNLLFRDLKLSKESLADQAEELASANRKLEQEIVERKQIEQAQRSQWEMLIKVLDTLENRVYISNPNYDIEYINPSIAKRYGPALGRKCYEYFHGSSAICPWCRNNEVFAGTATRWEWHSAKTGKSYDVISTPIRNTEGTISRLTLLQDITEKKQATSQIQLQTRILSRVKDAVIVLDEHYGIASWNAGSEAVFGWKEDEIAGKPLTDVFHRQFFNSDSAESVGTGVMQHRKDGTPVWIDYCFFPVQNPAGQVSGYVCLLRDVTERVRSEESLRKSEELYRNFSVHLEQAMEKERQCIAHEIHDEFGQILTALKWDLCSLDEDKWGDNKRRATCIQSMSAMIDDATNSIQSVTERLRPTQLDNLGLGPAIEWHTAEFQKRTSIKCKLNLEDETESVRGDRAIAVFRILQEALTNVARHSQATGVDICFKRKNGRLLLMVRDNGKGITADRKSDNRSFGLMGMRERASSCGGEIEISGVEGVGTTVRLSIPAACKEDTSDKSSCR